MEAFFEEVYNNPSKSYADAMKTLEKTVPQLFALSTRKETKAAFDCFKDQLEFVTKSPQSCYWYCFFTDFWNLNFELEVLHGKEELSVSLSRSPLCSRPRHRFS